MGSRQKLRQKKVLEGKDNNAYNIESQNINNMKKNDIKKFSELFFRQECTTTHIKNTRKEKDRRNSFAIPKQM